eukprot:TRINITY_DN1119_c0_g1_i4.p1 TRINITY_DN1119_c0_g1~~TRINITY_DN1119_c0_g1_i4.p1  ORF type:complete len:441 (-),score=135.44 TRINITY_DN1119_c0_g1_i4:405-1691(-)
MDEIDITPDKSGKVLKTILSPGDSSSGTPTPGDSVKVHYTGTLASDGSKFDSSVDRNEKFEFKVGVGQVIKGWDIGILGMTIGEKARFLIQSDYAYGDRGSPPKIPGGATLVFEVELFSFRGADVSEAKDEGILKRILTEGKGNHPKENAFIDISLVGKLQGKEPFDTRENVKYALGYGFENKIPSGLETALKTMSPGERSEVTLTTPKYCEEVYTSFSVAKGSVPLVYEVTLNSMEQSTDPWENSPAENLESAKSTKLKGNEYFKKGDFSVAGKIYAKAQGFIKDSAGSGSTGAEWAEVSKSIRLNLAACHLKLSEHTEARSLCDELILGHPDCVKALFRRGEALLGLSEPALAKKDFKSVLDVEPDNKIARNRLLEATNKIADQKKKEASLYNNMFDKFAANDAKREAEAQKRVKPVEIEDWEKAS